MNRILIVGFTMLLLSLVVKRYKLKDIVEAFSNDDQHWLIIGIMSAQNNFEARQSIRLTWRKMLMEKKIHYYFLVGHHTCPIPYPDRIDEFSCTEWPIRLHKDIGKLKSHIASESDRKRLWLEQTAMLKLNLVAESQEMKDILFLNVIDVYRNLPRKLLQFLQWLHMNKDFSYVMKTDDDTFVDVFAVEKELSEVRKKNFLSTSDVCQFWWWSTFREGWPVQAAGKWREDAYHSSTYPPFPCGAGYVLNNNIVHFLGSNAHILYPNFQGEDVSIGIWLAGLNPCKHSHSNTSCTWSCGEPVSGTACNKAQLSIHSMLHIWSHYQSQSPFK